MNANLVQAVSLLGIYTARRYSFWFLAGPSKASCRAHIMSALLGRKATQRESGVCAMRAEFYRQLGDVIPQTDICEAAREDAFTEWAKGILHANN